MHPRREDMHARLLHVAPPGISPSSAQQVEYPTQFLTNWPATRLVDPASHLLI